MLRSFVVSALVMGVLGIVFAPSASANPCSGRGAEATYASFGCYYPSPWSDAILRRNPVRHRVLYAATVTKRAAARYPVMKLKTVKAESKKLTNAACAYKGVIQVWRQGTMFAPILTGAANQCVKGSKYQEGCHVDPGAEFMGYCDRIGFTVRDPLDKRELIHCTAKATVWYDFTLVEHKPQNVKLYSLLTDGDCHYEDGKA
jgi:hypothetical protein